MKEPESSARSHAPVLTNGSGTAAVLSASVGCFTLAVLAVLADNLPAIKSYFVLYDPTGPLSGVSMYAIVVWLLTWAALAWRWRNKTVSAGILVVAFVLFAVGVLLTFPPVGELF